MSEISTNTLKDTKPQTGSWVENAQLRRSLLAAILIFGLAIRLVGLDWDRGTHLQPDERFWADVANHTHMPDDWTWEKLLDPELSPANPRNYKPHWVYGTLPLWATEAFAGELMNERWAFVVEGLDSLGVDLLRDAPPDTPYEHRLRFNTGYDSNLIGRLLASIVDTATIGVVYLMARELSGRGAALVAALMQCLAVLHIQYSHFMGSEPWVAFFVALGSWGAIRMARKRGGWPTALMTALGVGLAVGSKLSGVAVVAGVFAAALVLIWPLIQSERYLSALSKFGQFVIIGALSLIFYRMVQPYDFEAGFSFKPNQRFLDDLKYLSDVNDGGNWPWVQPLVGTKPLLHPLKQAFLWGMGPGIAVPAIGGIVHAAISLRKQRFWLVPLAVIGAYMALVSTQFYAIVRYLQPAYPPAIALAGCFIWTLWSWASRNALLSRTNSSLSDADSDITVDFSRPSVLAWLAKGFVALSLAATVFWGLAFVNGVYGRDNARLAASDWMAENLPAGSMLSAQSWDDPLPWGVSHTFSHHTLEPFSFGGDTPEHIERLILGLDKVDYVVESSNKFYDSLPKTPARFPQISAYYDSLFDGSLGFELHRTFKNDPTLFGITIDDSSAEEAFTLYDHPTVHIFKKTDDFSIEKATEVLNPDRARSAVNAFPKDGMANGSMLRPQAYEAQQNGQSFSEVHTSTASGWDAVIGWYVTIQLLSWALAPAALRWAGNTLGGGVYGLAKPFSFALLSLTVWSLVSWNLFYYSKTLIAVTLAVLALVALGSQYRLLAKPRELLALLVRHRKTIIATELLFGVFFILGVLLRMANPDIWHPWRGGEKPMELAYFTAITGSTVMPPYDPWHAGGTLNYYYFGWFILSVPARLLGYMPDVSFNLAVATVAALIAVTLFSSTVVLATRANRTSNTDGEHVDSIGPIKTGFFASLLFLVLGNLDSVRQLKVRLLNGHPLKDFDWWDPSRVVKDSQGFEVTEFPMFTWLFADLHPHYMAMPFFGLTLALAYAHIEKSRLSHNRSVFALTAALGAVAAMMQMLHTWDLPATLGICVATVLLSAFVATGPALWRLVSAVAQLVTFALCYLLVGAPYRWNYQLSQSGFKANDIPTNFDDWLVHWGLFLVIALLYLSLDIASKAKRVRIVNWILTILIAGSFVGFAAFFIGLAAALAMLGLVAAATSLIVELSSSRSRSVNVFVAACWLLGFAILVMVETLTQKADIQRLNTVFKFWLQSWHLFSLAGAFSAATVLVPVLKPLLGDKSADVSNAKLPGLRYENRNALSRSWRTVGAVTMAVLISLTALYPIFSVRPRLSNRLDTATGLSLQGDMWLREGLIQIGVRDGRGEEFLIDPGTDKVVIDWLRNNIEGRPTILEAIGGAEYQWYSRFAIHTGLPTVQGWRWHQSQQRFQFAPLVDMRNRDIHDFYWTHDPDAISAFLRSYDVSYVVIGSIEAAIADPATLTILARHEALERVFSHGEYRVYKVDKDWLISTRKPPAPIPG